MCMCMCMCAPHVCMCMCAVEERLACALLLQHEDVLGVLVDVLAQGHDFLDEPTECLLGRIGARAESGAGEEKKAWVGVGVGEGAGVEAGARAGAGAGAAGAQGAVARRASIFSRRATSDFLTAASDFFRASMSVLIWSNLRSNLRLSSSTRSATALIICSVCTKLAFT